jgi:urocanate reductase
MRHDPRWTEKFGTTNHAGATGETLNMAQDVGAGVIGMDYIQSIGPTGPDARFVKGAAGFAPLFDNPMFMTGKLKVNYSIYTDLRGNRIVASDARRDVITEATMRTPERVCVGIYDAVAREMNNKPPDQVFPEERFQAMMNKRPREMYTANTLRELAQKIGMPDPKVLEETVARYNSFVDAKRDPDFGQNPINLVWKCEKPPFWAASGSPAIHHTMGGLRTKGASTVVLDRWNREIPGLFAAGEITGGVHGSNRVGGNATADCLVFGRLAGREVAAQKSGA